jgi:hypothetical protein
MVDAVGSLDRVAGVVQMLSPSAGVAEEAG